MITSTDVKKTRAYALISGVEQKLFTKKNNLMEINLGYNMSNLTSFKNWVEKKNPNPKVMAVVAELLQINELAFSEMASMVREFQVASDQPTADKPSNSKVSDIVLRRDLMQEENKEYFDAAMEHDKVEILDAVVDKMYILLGTINQHGLHKQFAEAFKRVHENNMTKVVDGKVVRNEAGKILKPEGYVPVDLKDLL